MSEQTAFKAPAAPSAGLPQDLALIMELVGVPEPAPPACSSAGPFKQDTDREEEEPSEDDSPARVLKQLLPMGDDDEADKEDGEIESGSESDSSDSSSSSGSSSSTASSAAAGKGGGGRPSRKAHERNLSALDRLTREVSPANSDASEPDVDPSIFRSANEIPEPAKAPPLPFERIPEEDAVRELGVIRNVVGGSVIIEARLEVDARGQPLKEGGDAILGEGTIVCWDDGRVLGVVQDTFGPLTAPFYTFLLPDDFAQPTVQTPAAISAGETVEEKAAGPGVQEVAQTAEAVEQASEGQEKPPTPADVMITEDSNDSANITSDAGSTDAAAVDDALVEPAPVEESKDAATPAAPEKAEVVPPKGLVGLTVFYSYKSSKIVPTERLRKQKFTDASNKHDEEVGEDEMDWSDDEEEMLAKKRLKMMRQDRAASRAGSVRGGSPTPSLSSFSQHPDAPTSPTQSEAGSLYGGDFEADGETMIRLPGRAMPSAYEDWAEAASGPDDGTLGGGASGSAGGSSRGGGRGGRGDARGARGGRGNDRGNRGGKNDRGGRDGERGRGRGRGERGGARGGRGRGGADNAGNISNGSDGQHGLLFQGAAAYPTSLPALNGNGIYAPPFAAQQQQQADNSSLPPPPQAFSPLPRPQQQGGFMHYHPHQQPPPSVPFPGLSPQPTSNGQQFPRPPQPQQQQQQQGPPRYNHPGYPQQQQQQHYGMQTQGGPPGHFNPSFGVQNGGYPAPVGFPVYPGQGGGYGGMGGFPGGGPPQGYNGGAMGNSRPPPQNQQLGQNAHGLNGFAPAPPSGSGGNPSNQDPAIQRALAEQQQKHERQLLEMQRQIALLSRRNAGSPGGAPAPGTGGTWQGPSDGGAF